MREYAAMIQHRKGGTEFVALQARNVSDALLRLRKLGYPRVLWVM